MNIETFYTFLSAASSSAESPSVREAVDTTTITNLSEAMDKFGILTVVIAAMVVCIGIFVLYTLSTNKKKSDNLTNLLKEQNENTLKQNAVLLEKITELAEQHLKETETEKNLISIFMKLNDTLKDECHNVQTKLDCARVGIYACHNGSKTNTGLPFFKTSCISEWVSPKYLCSGGIGFHTDLQLGMFYTLVKEVFEHGYCIIKDIDQPDESEKNVNVYKYVTALGVSSSVIVAITNYEGLHIGSVTIEFKHPLDDEDKINFAIAEGKKLAEKIVPLLDYSLDEYNK